MKKIRKQRKYKLANRVSANRRSLTEQLEPRHLLAGPYAPAAGQAGSTAIAHDDAAIVAWASQISYSAGTNVDADFQTPTNAIGPATANAENTVSLGRGGQVTLQFDLPIRDGLGADFAVFENAFNDTFLELGHVEVSSDGTNFFRFASDSLTPGSVDAFGSVDPTEVNHLAGKYRQGFGTPFDLEELVGVSNLLDVNRVTHVRIIDVVGDGSVTDSSGDAIFDPFPTIGSAGFDLDAVGVMRQSQVLTEVAGFEDVGASLASQSAFNGPVANGQTITGPFDDTVVVGTFESEDLLFNNAYSQDFGSWNGWAYSNVTDNTTAGFANQFGSFAGDGASDSATFGVAFQDIGGFYDLPTITRDQDDMRRLDSIMITNTTYAALSMRDGDTFAKKFGGDSGNDPDFLLLTINGKNGNGVSIGQVDFYLADYRFADNTLDYIVDEWTRVDLSSLADARTIDFSFASSDVGQFGINTPVYFAGDDITFVTPVLPLDIADLAVSESAGTTATTVRVSRPDDDTSSPIVVSLNSSAPNDVIVPESMTIPMGERYAEFSVQVVNDGLVDGDLTARITATADGFAMGEGEVTVLDDDVLMLTSNLQGQQINEGTTFELTITRNNADLSSALPLTVSTPDPNRLTFPDNIAIPVGDMSSTFTVTTVRDFVDGPDLQTGLMVDAAGYVSVDLPVTISDVDNATVTVTANSMTFDEDDAAQTIGFEDLASGLPIEGYYNGSDQAGQFQSGDLAFNNDFNPTFGSWSGWAYSNTTNTTTPGFLNQFSAFAGSGAMGSETYAVASAYTPPVIARSADSAPFESLQVTNTTYAALSMLNGDNFAKQFGGPDGNDPDFFMLTIDGLDASGQSIGEVDFYLADYRFTDNTLDYIVDEWTNIDLGSIGNARSLQFSLSSSDVGQFGMNTPAYVAVDDIKLANQASQPTITVSRNTADNTQPISVMLMSSDNSELVAPHSATIPAGESSVDVVLRIEDDFVVDGDQPVTITANASGYIGDSTEVIVEDNDVPTISLTALTPQVDESSQDGRLLVYRNTADLNASLGFTLTANPDDQLQLSGMNLIPQGQSRVEVVFSAVDNDEIDVDRQVSVSAAADGWTTGETIVTVLNDDFPPPNLTVELDRQQLSEADAQRLAGFEDAAFRLQAESFYNGADFNGGFESDTVSLNNSYESTFGSWGGFSLSNTTDVTTAGFTNQYSAYAGGGASGTETYAVANAFPGGLVPTVSLDPNSGEAFESLMITNTTYAALSMRDGDAFAKQFGGETGDDPDFFLLNIQGVDASGDSVGEIDFYLADYRDQDNSDDFIVDQWTQVDLSTLVGATALQFYLSSSDVGQFGMNTPAYFAIDEIQLTQQDQPQAMATVTRDDDDLSEPLTVTIQADQTGEVWVPSEVVIPAGDNQATFAIQALDDFVVDGDQQIQISVEAPAHVGDAATIEVQDDDTARLTVALTRNQISESAGEAAANLVVHRNDADLSQDLVVTLTSGGVYEMLPAEVTIPAGSSRVLAPVDTIDNQAVDGDKTVTISASAVGGINGMTQLEILDDDVAGIIITATDDATIVSQGNLRDSLTVSLSAMPLSDVVLDLSFDGTGLVIDPAQLTFTPDDWDQPQAVDVQAAFDWSIDDEQTVSLVAASNADVSNVAFAQVSSSADVTIQDYQPTDVRLTEDDTQLVLLDEHVDVVDPLAASPIRSGVSIQTNELSQTITIDPLVNASGLILIDTAGGDDTVVLRGDRFTAINGGEGFDELIIGLDQANVDLVDLLDNRTSGFEQITFDSETNEQVLVDLDSLDLVLGDGTDLTVHLREGQELLVSGQAVNEDPVMVGDAVAQSIRIADAVFYVVSQSSWQNALDPLDVDRNGMVSPLDALLVINELSSGTTDLPPLATLSDFDGAYYDVTGESELSPLDALLVLNHLSLPDYDAAQAEQVEPVDFLRTADDSDAVAGELLFDIQLYDDHSNRLVSSGNAVDQYFQNYAVESSSGLLATIDPSESELIELEFLVDVDWQSV